MQSSADNIWPAAQHLLRTMLNPDIYNLWFHPIRAVAMEEETIVLEVANDFCEVWLKENYLGLIRDVLAQCTGQTLKVRFFGESGGAKASSSLQGDHGAAEEEPKAKAKHAAEPAERAASATNAGGEGAELQSEEYI